MSEPLSASRFMFDTDFPAAGESLVSSPITSASSEMERLERALEASGEVAYHWVIETDEITWSANVQDVLGCDQLSSGRAFAAYLDADNFTSRYDTVMRTPMVDEGNGVSFQIEYVFRPEGRAGRKSIWLEDHGKWFGGSDGRPVEVYGVLRRIDDRHKRDQHLSFIGNCDPLTGLMNRGRMSVALGEAMTVAARDGTSCAFLIAAINNLAVVNEAYGFEVADEVIVSMSRRLRQVVRTGDAISRYSGAKFGVILNHSGEEEVNAAVERFLGVARESVIETAHGPVWALLSIGGLVLPKHAADANAAMARAEEALTEARKLPSDGYVIYRPSPQRAADRKQNAHRATEIVRCLKEDRFKLAFQPIVAASTRETVFYEALLRMTGPAGETIAAAHLIPVAEKLGLVRLIDRAVVQMAIATLQKHPQARLTLNLSGTTAADPRWYPQIMEILAGNRGAAERLVIEITETVALNDLKDTRQFVEQLRDLGCSVAIDDFGAGYTSFRNLQALPVDILKIDGSFCRNLKDDADNRYFVRALIDLARTFKLKTVAEWVESEDDAGLLCEWKIDYLQGNIFGEATLVAPWQETAAPENFIAPAPAPAEATLVEAAPAAPLERAGESNSFQEFEEALPHELSKLRQAIVALDASFKRGRPEKASEPSERFGIAG